MNFNKIYQLNFFLIFIIILLLGIGTAALYSAAEGNFQPWAFKHLIRFSSMFVLMIIISLVNNHRGLQL